MKYNNKSNKIILVILSLIAVTVIVFTLFQSSRKPEDIVLAGKTKIRLQLQWFDQAQFCGFYVAKAKGYYNDLGLDVTINPGGYSINPIGAVVGNNADIGIATADQVLIKKAERADIKALGATFNTSLACFMSKKKLNIKGPQDLIGKKVGVYRGFDTENILMSILKKHDVDTKKVNIVDAASITPFVSGEMDVFPSYVINEPLQMEQNGIPVDVITPDKFGIKFYSDVVFTTTKYYSEQNEVLQRFIKASALGWDYAAKHQDEALKIMYDSIKETAPTMISERHQKEMLAKAVQYLGAGPHKQIFYMERSVWDSMEKSLLEIGKIKTQGNVDDLCDFSIVDKAIK